MWGRERASRGTRGQTTGEWKGEGRGREKQRRDNTRGWESLPANLIMGGALSFLQNIGKKYVYACRENKNCARGLK